MANTYPYSRLQAANSKSGQYYTVSQAAQLLQVSHSTVWRWIEAGKLPAYRVGPKAIRIKKQDLELVIQPATDQRKEVEEMKEQEQGTILTQPRPKPLSDDEVRQGLAALAQLRQLRQTLAKRHAGKHFPTAEELIRQERAERAKRL